MTETLRPLDYRATPTELPASPVLREIDGRLVVEWPSPRPSWFACSPDVVDQLVERVNRLEDECQELDAALTGQRDDGPDLCGACDVEAADCHASIRSGSVKCCPDCQHRGDPWAREAGALSPATCPHLSATGDEGPARDLPGGIVVRWRCDGCSRVTYAEDAIARLRAGYRP